MPDSKLGIILNGHRLADDSTHETYFTLRRMWKNGDVLHVELPMQLSAEKLPRSEQYVAFLYGPIVLSGELGRGGGLTKQDFWQIEEKVPRKLVPESDTPTLVAEDNADLLQHIKLVDTHSLRFRTSGFQPGDVPLVPFFENHFQRYAVYWRRLTPAAFQQEREKLATAAREREALEARTVDVVAIGDDNSEKAHDLRSRNSASGFGAYDEEMQTRWRDARDGGWFSYRMAVSGDRPLFLRCTYWGDERGARTFDLLVNDKVLSTESLQPGRHEFIQKDIRLPDELLAGLNYVTVKFQAHGGNAAGGLFGLRILRGQ